MDSLERLFFTVSAASAALALVLFGMYFNLGNMVMAALRGPGNFQEWAFQQQRRAAETLAINPEIKPLEGGEGYAVRGTSEGGSVFAVYNGPPVIPLDHTLKRERMKLVQKGFTDQGYLEMESLFRADRSFVQGIYSVDVLVMRGDPMAALEELELQMQKLNPRNARGLLELVQLRGRLLAQLQAPPDQLYDQVMQHIQLQAKILQIEVKGYQGIPKYRTLLAASEVKLREARKLLEYYRTRRSEALQFFASGAYGDQELDPKTARLIKAAAKRAQKLAPLHPDEEHSLMQLVDTRVEAYTRSRGGGGPDE